MPDFCPATSIRRPPGSVMSIGDELTNRAAEEMNRRMYILSLVAAVFLPLGLITGLLGVNVGGVPGTNYEWGFWVLSGALVAIGVLTTFFLNRLF